MNIVSLVKRAPKRLSAVVAIVAAAIIVPTAVFAWGPSRDTYTIENPANKITFNSITNNPNYGDERNFVTIKDKANTNAGGWTDDITVQNGKTYLVRAYVHNNAATSLNLVAENVTAKFNVPTHSASRIQIDGYISASNSDPLQVWDQAVFHGANNAKFSLDYVEGSAKYTNKKNTSGVSRPDTIISSGVKLGYETMDGKIPGCFEYTGYVTFEVKAVTSDFEVQKTVRVNGATDKSFKESVAVEAGDKVDYQMYFKNTGGTQLKDVVLKDQLPAGVSYVPDSTYLSTSDGVSKVGDGITSNGLNIGGFLPGGDAYVKFTAKVNENVTLTCGPNTLKNTVTAITAVGSKSDTANLTLQKECEPGKIKVCELSTKKVITIDENAFDSSKHSTDLTKCDDTEVKKIQVCDLSTKKIVMINESDFDSKKHTTDLKKCDTPNELPHTGPVDTILGLFGLGAIVASAAYFVASRRAARGL